MNIYAFIKKTKIHDSSRFHEHSTKRKKSILIKLHDSHRIQSRSKPLSSNFRISSYAWSARHEEKFLSSETRRIGVRTLFRKKVFEYGFFVHGLWDRDACGKLKEGTLLYRFEVSDPSLENTSPDGDGCLRATKILSSPPSIPRHHCSWQFYISARSCTQCLQDLGDVSEIMDWPGGYIEFYAEKLYKMIRYEGLF